MINIPKKICNECYNIENKFIPVSIPAIDACPDVCKVPEIEFIPVPALSLLCECPTEEKEITVIQPPPNVVTEIESCYFDFIRKIPTTKFCNLGPKCR